MEFKGTKGKWRLENSSFYSDRKCIFSDFRNRFGDKLLLSIDDCDNQEQRANALLISKAPEMLEILKDIVHANNMGNFEHLNFYQIEQLIKEATELT